MRYLYICPGCKKAFSMESIQPDKTMQCSVCETKLIYANCTKEEWDQKTEEEKKAIKETALQQHLTVEMSTEGQILHYLSRMDNSLSTIKGILIFFTVLAVIGIIVALIVAAQVSDALSDISYFFRSF